MSLDAMITQARARQVEREAEQERQELAEEQQKRARDRENLIEQMKKYLGQQFLSLCAIGYNEEQEQHYAHIVRHGTDVHIYHRILRNPGTEALHVYWELLSLLEKWHVTIRYDGDETTPEEIFDGVMLAIDELTK